MRRSLPVLAWLFLPLAASAGTVTTPDTGWQGSGELGFALSRGNTRSESLNAKLTFKKEDASWKDNFYLSALRNKGTVEVTTVVNGQTVSGQSYQSTANRIETGASVGYKLDPRSYIVTALRYEHDDFAAYQWQATASVGYGYILIKDKATELSFEIGPGYKRMQSADYTLSEGQPPQLVVVHPATESQAIVRALVSFKHQLTATTAFEDRFLIEAGSDNRFTQNDAGLVVAINKKLALKLAWQVRHNSDVVFGDKHTDQLLTTNLVYNF